MSQAGPAPSSPVPVCDWKAGRFATGRASGAGHLAGVERRGLPPVPALVTGTPGWCGGASPPLLGDVCEEWGEDAGRARVCRHMCSCAHVCAHVLMYTCSLVCVYTVSSLMCLCCTGVYMLTLVYIYCTHNMYTLRCICVHAHSCVYTVTRYEPLVCIRTVTCACAPVHTHMCSLV